MSPDPACRAKDFGYLAETARELVELLRNDAAVPASVRARVRDAPAWTPDDLRLRLAEFTLGAQATDLVPPAYLLRLPPALCGPELRAKLGAADAPVELGIGGDRKGGDEEEDAEKEGLSCPVLVGRQKRHRVRLTVENLLTCLPRRWLDSVVIDAYVHAMVELSPYKNEIYVLSAQADASFREIAATPRCYRYILAPLFRNSHWTVLFVDHGERGAGSGSGSVGRVRHLNSQIVNPRTPVVQTAPWCECFPTYQVNDLRVAAQHLPQQNNMYDCGIWVCFWTMAFLFFTDEELDSVREETVAGFRTQVLQQILQHYVVLPFEDLVPTLRAEARRG